MFVASIHHMDMMRALEKAKSLLSPQGMVLIVGLAKPSSALDYAVEVLRVAPCRILSRVKRLRACEDEQIPVSYQLPPLRAVRAAIRRALPHSRLQQGLYYRYLLIWRKAAASCV